MAFVFGGSKRAHGRRATFMCTGEWELILDFRFKIEKKKRRREKKKKPSFERDVQIQFPIICD